MRILMLTAADSIHAVRWANAFVDCGHEVHFVTLSNHKNKLDSFSESVKLHYLPYGGSFGYITNVGALKRLYKQISPDVVNVHYASGYGLLMRLAKLKNVVLSVWGSDVYDYPYKSFISKRIVISNLKYADRIASTSNIMAEQVKRLLNDNNKPITITPFGVDVDKFTPSGEKAINDSCFWFGLVKKLTYKYGIDYIINSFDDFYKRWVSGGSLGPEPHLFICGKGENKGDFEKMINEKGIENLVTIQGYIPNEKVPSLLRSFDVFCLGSQLNSESFGVSAVEAMACGIPVIATDVDGFKEVIVNNSTGFIVNKTSTVEMSDMMYKLYYDDELRSRFGINGRDRVLSLYNWNDNVLTLERLLKEVAEKGK